jgi:hypothetical protein
MQSTKRNSNGKENETKKDMQHDLKLCGKKGKIYEAGVALTEDPEATTTICPKENLQQCKHCGRNDHQQKTTPSVHSFKAKCIILALAGTHMEADTLLANTPQKDTFASSVVSIGLQ